MVMGTEISKIGEVQKRVTLLLNPLFAILVKITFLSQHLRDTSEVHLQESRMLEGFACLFFVTMLHAYNCFKDNFNMKTRMYVFCFCF